MRRFFTLFERDLSGWMGSERNTQEQKELQDQGFLILSDHGRLEVWLAALRPLKLEKVYLIMVNCFIRKFLQEERGLMQLATEALFVDGRRVFQ